MWKATDGIAETTWPGVYNRSRLPGRHDYFELPDWNVYVDGGKAVTFTLPNEAWNHLEMQGTADGTLTLRSGRGAPSIRWRRARQGQERTADDFAALTGGRLTLRQRRPRKIRSRRSPPTMCTRRRRAQGRDKR